MGIDGLVSGLNTTSLINSLMQVEAQPQTMLKSKVASTQGLVSALQSLNTRASTLGSLGGSIAAVGALDLYTATSSDPGVTVTAAAGASVGRIDVSVGQTAQRQVMVSAQMTAWPASPAALTIVGADGTSTEITAVSTSLDDVVTAVNAAGAGVTAMKVAAGTDASGTSQYRLQFSSEQTGAGGAFTVYRGTKADVSAGTGVDLAAAPGAATIQSARDASVTLWAGSAAAQTIASSSNTFTNLFPGVSVTVTAPTTTPATLTIAKDANAVSAKASSLVTSLNDLLGYISNQTASTSSTDPNTGRAVITGGVLSGESVVRDVNQSMITAASLPVNGHSPSEYGISINSTGSFDFDSTKFQTALAKDPAGVQNVLQTLGQRIADAAKIVSDRDTGTITSTITGQQSLITNYNSQITDWDTTLADRRAALEKTYATLEVNLSNLQSQSSWLTGQLASLPTPSRPAA
jgi:flagellar hook-associated protein 2